VQKETAVAIPRNDFIGQHPIHPQGFRKIRNTLGPFGSFIIFKLFVLLASPTGFEPVLSP
jgi:hypothetical protein